MFCVPQAIHKTPGPSVSAENTSNIVYRNDKISEIVSDSDSDGGSFSEHSDGKTCTVEYILITRNKFIFDHHTHDCVTQVIFAGLLEFVSGYSHPIWNFCSNVSG
jgi:hypothetical protein